MSNRNQKIWQLNIITAQGAKQWTIGKDVESITIEPLLFTGDPFDHYVGKDKNGKIVFTVHPSTPLEVCYLTAEIK